MIENAIRPDGDVLAHRVHHQVAGKLAGGHAAALEPPHDAPGSTLVVKFHDADVRNRVEGHIAHERARRRHQELLARKVDQRRRQRNPA